MSRGYISAEVRRRVRERAGDRCGYCLCPQRLVYGVLEVEHVIPLAQGGADDEENLWLACRLCNGFKGDQVRGPDPQSGKQVPLFHPRTQIWGDHFEWSSDGVRIVGKTRCTRATVIALQLNNELALTVRAAWVAVGWHPPEDAPRQGA